jgi:hypothetical protein
MAFLKTSDSIIINATLTEKGRKLLARGKFKVSKFSFGDDEIDYSLFNAVSASTTDAYRPALLNTYSLEAYGDRLKNIQYGLNSYDSGILYLKDVEIEAMAPDIHAYIEFLPELVLNEKLSVSPTKRDYVYYVSVNSETTEKLHTISGFRFLESSNLENCKIIIESGINREIPTLADGTDPIPTLQTRRDYILKKFLLDRDFFINADNRIISQIAAAKPTSKFEGPAQAEVSTTRVAEINFETLREVVPISLENEFPSFATYVASAIPNLLYDQEGISSATNLSALPGPRGSVLALNVVVDNELKINSTGPRDFRYKKFGEVGKIVFSELPSSKFDYIDTTIYVYGGTTNSRLQVPLRIIRYSGV